MTRMPPEGSQPSSVIPPPTCPDWKLERQSHDPGSDLRGLRISGKPKLDERSSVCPLRALRSISRRTPPTSLSHGGKGYSNSDYPVRHVRLGWMRSGGLRSVRRRSQSLVMRLDERLRRGRPPPPAARAPARSAGSRWWPRRSVVEMAAERFGYKLNQHIRGSLGALLAGAQDVGRRHRVDILRLDRGAVSVPAREVQDPRPCARGARCELAF